MNLPATIAALVQAQNNAFGSGGSSTSLNSPQDLLFAGWQCIQMVADRIFV
jgi:hypothetical protein